MIVAVSTYPENNVKLFKSNGLAHSVVVVVGGTVITPVPSILQLVSINIPPDKLQSKTVVVVVVVG